MEEKEKTWVEEETKQSGFGIQRNRKNNNKNKAELEGMRQRKRKQKSLQPPCFWISATEENGENFGKRPYLVVFLFVLLDPLGFYNALNILIT